MPKIFISYRHDDASESASRLHETLTGCFGSQYIFWDHDSIHAGTIYFDDIKEAIDSSTTLLAVIGRNWLTIKEDETRQEDETRRLDKPDDILRWEIARALGRADRGEDIRVIPVLVGGASFPYEEDLPKELKRLTKHKHIALRPQNWREDVKPLIQTIEKDFKTNFRYSFFGGAIAGLIAGVIVGWLYYQRIDRDAGPGRIFYGGLYGLFAGAVLSYFIGSGVTWRSWLLNKAAYSKIIDGTIGGALGGILAGIAGWLLFSHLGGAVLAPEYLMFAVAVSSMFVTLGILLPELKGAWYKTVLLVIILVCITSIAASITMVVLDLFKDFDKGSTSPLYKRVVVLGSICGMMSGFQVGSTLFVYERFKDRLGK